MTSTSGILLKPLSEAAARKVGHLGIRGLIQAGIDSGNLDDQAISRLEARSDVYRHVVVDNELVPGLKTHAIANQQAIKEPELFWGPFMQLGTYLGVENQVARFAIDLVADPTNLATLGTGFLLNTGGKTAKIMSAVYKGGRAVDAAGDVISAGRAISKVDEVLQFVGKARNTPGFMDELKASAKGVFNGRRFNKLLKQVDSAALPDEYAQVIDSLRKNRKGLANLMDMAVKHGDEAIPARNAFLQATRRARIAAGQVNPILQIDKPFALTRQLVGLPYRNGPVLWSPAGKTTLFGSAIDNVAPKVAGEVPGVQRVDPRFDVEALEFVPRKIADGDITANEVDYLTDEFIALAASPGTTMRNVVDAMRPDDWADLARKEDFVGAPLRGQGKTRKQAREWLETAEGSAWREGVAKDSMAEGWAEIETRRHVVDQSMARIEERLTEFEVQRAGAIKVGDEVQWTSDGVDRFDSPRQVQRIETHAESGQDFAFFEGSSTGVPVEELTRDAAASRRSGIRSTKAGAALPDETVEYLASTESAVDQLRLLRSAMDMRVVADDAAGPAHALGGLARMFDWKAGRLTEARKEVFQRHYPKAGERERVVHAYRALSEHPSLWTIQGDGSARILSTTDVAAESPLLARFMENDPKLVKYLTERGMPAEIVQQAAADRRLFDALGEQAFEHEFFIPQFIQEYFPRSIRLTNKGIKEGKDVFNITDAKAAKVRRSLTDDKLLDQASPIAGLFKSIEDDLIQGKKTFQEVRHATESKIADWLDKGWVTWDDDALSLVGEYASAASRVSLYQRFYRDMPVMAGKLTPAHRETFDAYFGGAGQALFGRLAGNTDDLWKRAEGADIIHMADPESVDHELYEAFAPQRLYNLPTAAEQTEADWLMAMLRRPNYVEAQGKLRWKRKPMKGYARFELPTESGVTTIRPLKNGTWSVRLAGGKGEVLRASTLDEAKALGEASAWRQVGDVSVTPRMRELSRGRVADDVLEHPGKYGLDEEQARNLGRDFLTTDGLTMPKRSGVKSPGFTRRKILEARGSEIGVVQNELFQARTKLLEQARGRVYTPPGKDKLYILKPFAGPMREAFRQISSEGLKSQRGWAMFDAVQSTLKAVQLAIDAFHGQTMSMVSLIANPAAAARVLAEPGSNFQTSFAGGGIARQGFVQRTAIGAAVGAGSTAALGGDMEEVAMGGVVAAAWSNMLTAAMRNSIKGRRAGLMPGSQQPLAYMALSGWTGRPADRAIGKVGRLLKGWSEGIKSKWGENMLTHAIDGTRHFEEGFNQLIWEQIHNGAKTAYFANRFAAVKMELAKAGKLGVKMNGNVDELLLEKSREIMQTANVMFGGQQFALLLKEPEFRAAYQRFFLAPDWTLGRMLGAFNMALNMTSGQAFAAGSAAGTVYEMAEKGWDLEHMTWNGALMGGALATVGARWAGRVRARMLTPGDEMAREARRMYSSALMGGYVMGNLLNKAMTGNWMWENPEGDKLSVMMPDGTRISYGKAWKEAFEFTGAEDKYPIPVVSRAASKANLPVRMSVSLLSNQGFFGPIVATEDREPWQVAGSYARFVLNELTPITASGPSRAAANILDGENPLQQLTQAAIRASGIQVGAPRRPSPEARRAQGLQTLLQGSSPPPLSPWSTPLQPFR